MLSELVKNAKISYEYAIDSEKKKIALTMFSELTIDGGIISKFKAKDGIEAVLKLHDLTNCGPGWTRTSEGEAKRFTVSPI